MIKKIEWMFEENTLTGIGKSNKRECDDVCFIQKCLSLFIEI